MAKPSCAQQELLLLCKKVFVFLVPNVNLFENRMQIFGGGCLLLDNFHPAGHGHDILESFALPRRRILAHFQYHVSYRKWYLDYAGKELVGVWIQITMVAWILAISFWFLCSYWREKYKKGWSVFSHVFGSYWYEELKNKNKNKNVIFDFWFLVSLSV